MGILTWLIWGLFVGALARVLLPGRARIGLVMTMVLGYPDSERLARKHRATEARARFTTRRPTP